MATVRLVNPHEQKNLTRAKVQRRQDQAVQFTRNVLDDHDLADEIESLSVEDYAARKGLRIENSNNERKVKNDMATQTRTSQESNLGSKLDQLTDAVEQLRSSSVTRRSNPAAEIPEDFGAKLDKLTDAVEEIRKSRMSNPTESSDVSSSVRSERRLKKLRSERDEILDSLQEVQDLMDEDQLDDAQDVLDGILDRYEVEEQE